MKMLSRITAVGALTISVFSSPYCLADGSVTFIHGGIGPSTDVNNGNAFQIDLNNGFKTLTFVNKTGKTIKDFHFSWANNLAVTGYDDLPDQQTKRYFESYTAANKSIDFYDQKNGVGIAPNEKFEISVSGFNGMANVTANATFDGGKGNTVIPNAPEPAESLMLIAGLGLLGGLVRYRKDRLKQGA